MEVLFCILIDIMLGFSTVFLVEVTMDVIFWVKIFKLLNDEDNRCFSERVIFNKDKKSKSKGDEK